MLESITSFFSVIVRKMSHPDIISRREEWLARHVATDYRTPVVEFLDIVLDAYNASIGSGEPSELVLDFVVAAENTRADVKVLSKLITTVTESL